MPAVAYALLSAVFAALTAILAKVGVAGVPSSLATAIRVTVILPFAWSVALLAGEGRALPHASKRTLIFLALSAIATGCSWLAYFRALQLWPASRVAPIDKLSLPLTLLAAWLILGEPITLRVALGAALMTAGALLTLG